MKETRVNRKEDRISKAKDDFAHHRDLMIGYYSSLARVNAFLKTHKVRGER